ncbi:MAG: FCD domain-containing protein [Actinobacteria bacterium]|nr:FCD domain-containing protein [Actinomycetota bacterium]
MTGKTKTAEPTLTSIKRVGPTQLVREQLLVAIESGAYQPGSALPSERVLCETFGVSRVSLREAIAGLEATGLITVQHGRGVFVRENVADQVSGPFGKYLEIHREEILELLKVRGALDALAAAEAAEHADDSGLDAVAAAAQAFETAVEHGADTGELAALDVAFHMSIAHAVPGELLPSLLGELNGQMQESRRIGLTREGKSGVSVRQHRAIVEAIRSRDPEAARRAVDVHIKGTISWFRMSGQVPASAS